MCDTGNPSALRAPRPFYRREAGLFVCFFHHRARLLRRHPGRPARRPARGLVRPASSQRHTKPVKTSASPLAYLFQNMKRSYPKAERQITAASSSYSFSVNQCFEKRVVCCGRTTTCNFPLCSNGSNGVDVQPAKRRHVHARFRI